MISIMNALSVICQDLIDNLFKLASRETLTNIINSHKHIIDSIVKRDEIAGYMAVNEHYDLVDKEICKWKEAL